MSKKCLLGFGILWGWILCVSSFAQTNYFLNLDGAGDYVVIPDQADLRLGAQDYTVSCWFLVRSWDTVDNVIALLSKRTTFQTGWGLSVVPDMTVDNVLLPDRHVINWAQGTGFTGKQMRTKTEIELNEWHHIAVTYSSTSEVFRMYFDGYLETENQNFPAVIDASLELRLGRNSFLNVNGINGFYYLDGLLEDVRIYDAALTNDDILNTYRSPISGAETNVVAYYNFDDLAVSDVSGNGHTGTLLGDSGFGYADTDYIKIKRGVYVPLPVTHPMSLYTLQYKQAGDWVDGEAAYGGGLDQILFDTTGRPAAIYRLKVENQ